MNNRHTISTSVLPGLCLLIVFGADAIRPSAWAQNQGLPIGTTGRVTKLKELTPPSQDPVLLGRIQLLGFAMDEALQVIDHDDLRAFATKWARAVDLYGQLGDQISQSSESIGAAEIALDRAERALLASQRPQHQPTESHAQAIADVEALRSQVMSRLRVLRVSFAEADEQQQKAMLPRLQALAQQWKQLEEVRRGLENRASDAAYASASRRLQAQIDQARQILEYECEMLQITSESVRVAMQSVQGEVRRAIRLAEVQTRIPRKEIVQMGRAREQIQIALSEVIQARRQAEQLVDRLLGVGVSEDVDHESVLEQVDAVLKSSE